MDARAVRYKGSWAAIVPAVLAALLWPGTEAQAQTPKEAYARGCGGCHQSEQAVLRKVPRRPEAERRAWLEAFMAQHPCERDDLKPLIVQYLLEKTQK